MRQKNFFSDTDRALIAEAVKEAEARTSGEIVPVIVPSSSDYPEALWKAVFFGTLTGLVAFESYLWRFSAWQNGDWVLSYGMPIFLLVSIVLFVGSIHYISPVKRFIVGRSAMDTSVHTRAVKAFVDHEVFNTRERTGIVLFISLFERRVEVFGDSGINERVAGEDWADIISEVIKGIKMGQATEGLVRGIKLCGDLLEASGVEIRDDDIDELSNEPRFEN